jgi:uncharacterized membrane protein YfcA
VTYGIAEGAALLAAGIAAGTINAVVGSGTLITFPTLLAFGFPPVVANVSNTIGLVPGVLSGIHGYRAELKGQRSRLLFLGSASLLGGVLGAILLLILPATAFKAIVPALIALALVMVLAQPVLARWVAVRQRARGGRGGGSRATASGGVILWLLIFGTGVYGGYFGAAQGVLLIGFLGLAFTDTLQRINAAKNVLAALVNGVAAAIFIALWVFASQQIAWGAVALIALGSVVGGQIGAKVGRRLPPAGLRVLIVCVGIAALVKLLS